MKSAFNRKTLPFESTILKRDTATPPLTRPKNRGLEDKSFDGRWKKGKASVELYRSTVGLGKIASKTMGRTVALRKPSFNPEATPQKSEADDPRPHITIPTVSELPVDKDPPVIHDTLTHLNAFYTQMSQHFEATKGEYLGQCSANFQTLIQTIERHRQSVFDKIDAFFVKLRHSLEVWRDNLSSSLVAAQNRLNCFDSPPNFDKEVTRIRDEVAGVERGLKGADLFNFFYDLQLFEQSKNFCSLIEKSSPFLQKFMEIQEDNLFLESIHDPFKEPEASVHATPVRKPLTTNRTSMPRLTVPNNPNRMSLSNKRSYVGTKLVDTPDLERHGSMNYQSLRRHPTAREVLRDEESPHAEMTYNFLSEANKNNIYRKKKTPGHSEAELFQSSLSNRRGSLSLRLKNFSEKKVTLTNNDFRGNEVVEVTSPLAHLDFAEKNLSNDELVRVFSAMKINGHVLTLDLSRNKINDGCLSKILESLRNSAIDSIVLNDNALTGASLDLLADFKALNSWTSRVALLRNDRIDWTDPSVKSKVEELRGHNLAVEF